MKQIGVLKFDKYNCVVVSYKDKFIVFLLGDVRTKSECIRDNKIVNTISTGYFKGCRYYKKNNLYILDTFTEECVIDATSGRSIKFKVVSNKLTVEMYNRNNNEIYSKTYWNLRGGD